MSVKHILSDEQIKILHEEYHNYFLEHISIDSSLQEKPTLHDFFDRLRKKDSSFVALTDKQLSNRIIAARRVEGEGEWPNINNLKEYISPQSRGLLKKSVNSCLLAVEAYNKPLSVFRTEGYIVLMMIAWTSIFHAYFIKKGMKIQYKDSQSNYLDLRKCIRKYDGIRKNEIVANLELLIEIRDRIVHRDNPIIDDKLFSYCQSCLFNFQAVSEEYFNERFLLKNGLVYSLQFSNKYTAEQLNSIKEYETKECYQLTSFINEYESKLKENALDIYESPHYAFRVYIIPQLVSKNKSEASIEYINYDQSNAEIKKDISKVIFAIQHNQSASGGFLANEVSKRVYNALKNKMPEGFKFSASSQHVKCINYFGIREGFRTSEPDNTKKDFCIYDSAFKQYKYTQQWIDFLIKKLKTQSIYNAIFGKQ